MLAQILVTLVIVGGFCVTPVAHAGDFDSYFDNFDTELQKESAASPAGSSGRSSWWQSLVGGVFGTAFDSGYQADVGDFESAGQTILGGVFAKVLSLLIGFLGVIATILVIYAGYLWMTAGGDDSQIEKAKSIIKQVVIGFIVLSLSYAIVSFVFSQVQKAAPGETPKQVPRDF